MAKDVKHYEEGFSGPDVSIEDGGSMRGKCGYGLVSREYLTEVDPCLAEGEAARAQFNNNLKPLKVGQLAAVFYYVLGIGEGLALITFVCENVKNWIISL